MSGLYDFSLTTFSPSGKLVQIEYALARVSSGNTSLAVKGINLIKLAYSKSKKWSCISHRKKASHINGQYNCAKN